MYWITSLFFFFFFFLPGTAGGWLPQRCDLQRCDLRKRGGHRRGWQPSITAGVPWDTLCSTATACSLASLSALTISCFLKSNTRLYLACPLHILQHGQGQQMPTTLLWDQTICGCCIKYSPWQLYLLCCFFVVANNTVTHSVTAEMNHWKRNDKYESAVDNKSTYSHNYAGHLYFKDPVNIACCA